MSTYRAIDSSSVFFIATLKDLKNMAEKADSEQLRGLPEYLRVLILVTAIETLLSICLI